MNDAPNDTPKEDSSQSQSDRARRVPNLFRDNIFVRLALIITVFIVGGTFSAIMFALSNYVPDYVVIGSVFVTGMIGWRLLVGALTRGDVRIWLWFTTSWGAISCGGYSWASHQKHSNELDGWFWIGAVLGVTSYIVGATTPLMGKKYKGKG